MTGIEPPISPFETASAPAARTVLEIRRDATQATLDKYRDAPFDPGACDCFQIVRTHCRELGAPLKFGVTTSYKTLLGGKSILRKAGFASLGEAIGSNFPEISPSEALIGDIVELRAMDDDDAKLAGLGALVVYLGNNACLGFHEAATGAIVMRYGELGSDAPLRAWRVLA